MTEESDKHKPSYSQAYVSVVSFFASMLFPGICTTEERSLALFSLPPIAMSLFWIQLQAGIENKLAYYACVGFVGLLLVGTLGFLYMANKMARQLLANRLAANPSALATVQKGLQTKRILREEGRYDIYLPRNETAKQGKSYSAGLVLLPGALVDYNAYAGLLSKLSDEGVVAIAQDCEPLRLSTEVNGSTEQAIRSCIQHAEEEHGFTVAKWAIGGHSLGGFTAMAIMKKSRFFDSLVLYGCNRSYELETTALRVLSVTATNDGLAKSKGSNIESYEPWKEDKYKGRLLHMAIEGGNHGGFGDYPQQTYPAPDGDRTISLEEQHKQIVETTARFLLVKD
jgi:dienelactone hydrolase